MRRLILELAQKFRPVMVKLFPIDFLRAVKRRMIRQAVQQMRSYQLPTFSPSSRERGINLIGYIQGETGLGQSCRLVAGALEASGLPYTIYNYQQVSSIRSSDHSWDRKISDQAPYDINLFHITPYEVPLAFTTLTPKFWDGRYNIAFWLWELEEIPEEWKDSLRCFQEVWTPAEFVSDSIRLATDKPVYTVPYYLQAAADSTIRRERFGLPEGIFLFLTMYDCTSTMDRKNPMGAVRAFKEAFLPQEKGVGLVIKLNNPSEKDLRVLREELSGYQNIWLLPEIYTKTETNSLISLADAVVSLHRAEGFGLVPAEAMLLGTPVVATNWSATTEFMDADSACLVDYRLVPIEKDIGPYKKGQRWADPDIHQAAAYMRRLYEDPDYRRRLAENGKHQVETILGREQAAEKIRTRIKEIYTEASGAL